MKLEWQELTLKPDHEHGSPLARSSHGLSVLQPPTDGGSKILWLYGGEHEARTPIGTTVWQADLNSGQWKAIEPKHGPSPRIAHAQAVHEDTIVYIFGGRTGIDMHESALQDLWAYDITTNTWTEVKAKGGTEPPEARSFHRMICHDNALYVFGGCGANGRLADLHKFDLTTQTWQALSESNLRGRGGTNFVVLNSTELLVWAGFAGEETNDGQVYDIAKDAWKTVESSTEQEIRPRSVCVASTLADNSVVLFGGEVNPSDRGHEGAGGFCQDVLIIAKEDNKDESADNDKAKLKFLQGDALGTPPTTMPCTRGWSAGDAMGNELYLFGGLTGDDANPQRLGDLWKLAIV